MFRVQVGQIRINNDRAVRLQKRIERLQTRIVKQHDMMIKHLDEYHKELISSVKTSIEHHQQQ